MYGFYGAPFMGYGGYGGCGCGRFNNFYNFGSGYGYRSGWNNRRCCRQGCRCRTFY